MSESSWPTFRDNAGDSWTIEITVDRVRMLRSELDLDLLAIVADKTILPRLATDDVLLVDTISLLLSDTIVRREMDAKTFAARIHGDVLQSAADAMIEAVAVFSRPQKRGLIRESWKAMTSTEQRVTTMAIERLPAMAQELTDKAEKLLAKSSD